MKKVLMHWLSGWNGNISWTGHVKHAENIFDVKRYVRANLSDIAAHYPDEFYNPAITRLYRLKDKMEGKDNAEWLGHPALSFS